MKRSQFSFLLTVAAVVALLLAAWPAEAVITGSAHDFSSDLWNPTGEICVVCHTPHNSDQTVDEAPLWNHQVTAATFQPYASATLNATVGQPNRISLLCLSCHDGTVAVDNFGGRTTGTNFLTGNRRLGTDLRNDHPVSFTYDAALVTADGGLHDPSTIGPLVLFAGTLECATCHDVHNGAGVARLLRWHNGGSALCLKCHAK